MASNQIPIPMGGNPGSAGPSQSQSAPRVQEGDVVSAYRQYAIPRPQHWTQHIRIVPVGQVNLQSFCIPTGPNVNWDQIVPDVQVNQGLQSPPQMSQPPSPPTVATVPEETRHATLPGTDQMQRHPVVPPTQPRDNNIMQQQQPNIMMQQQQPHINPQQQQPLPPHGMGIRNQLRPVITQPGQTRMTSPGGILLHQLIQALKAPETPEQGQQVLQILKAHPQIVTDFIKAKRDGLIPPNNLTDQPMVPSVMAPQQHNLIKGPQNVGMGIQHDTSHSEQPISLTPEQELLFMQQRQELNVMHVEQRQMLINPQHQEMRSIIRQKRKQRRETLGNNGGQLQGTQFLPHSENNQMSGNQMVDQNPNMSQISGTMNTTMPNQMGSGQPIGNLNLAMQSQRFGGMPDPVSSPMSSPTGPSGLPESGDGRTCSCGGFFRPHNLLRPSPSRARCSKGRLHLI